jgi:hypothetical protein
VEVYDGKTYSLNSSGEVGDAVENLLVLYDSVPESLPGFEWRDFDPESKLHKYYSKEDIELIVDILKQRRDALIGDLASESTNGQALFGYPIVTLENRLKAYEICVLGCLIENDMDSAVMSLEGAFQGFECSDEMFGYISSKRGRDNNSIHKLAVIRDHTGMEIQNGLNTIQWLKEAWMHRNKLTLDAIPSREDLSTHGRFPVRPEGAVYEINAVGESPVCIYKGKRYTLGQN